MRKIQGFTLIEMAVLLVVTGFILATVLPRIISGTKKDLMIEGKGIVRAAREEVLGYAMANCALPGKTSDQFDITDDLGHETGRRSGQLRFWPAPELTRASLSGANASILDQNTTSLELTLAGNETVSNVAFWIVGPGENGEFDEDYRQNSVDISYYDPGQWDDIFDYVTLDYLKRIASGCDTPPTPSDLDISFESSYTAFGPRMQESSSGSVILFNNATKSITMEKGTSGREGGCLWYDGDEGECVNGSCPFTESLKAFFTFQFKEGPGGNDDGGGFTFAVITSEKNDNPCGDARGATESYAGVASYLSGDDSYIHAPKMAVEFDVTQTGGASNDPSEDHMGVIYWGDDSDMQDDNYHGAGFGDPGFNPDSETVGATPGALFTGENLATRWLEDGTEYGVRIEISKSGNGTIIDTKALMVPVDLMDPSFRDIDSPYSESGNEYKVADTKNFNDSGLQEKFSNVRFGWTMGSGYNKGLEVTVSNFTINLQ